MPRDDLAKRIESINRRPLKNVPDANAQEQPDIAALRRKLRKGTGSTSPAPAPPATHSATPESIVYSRSVTQGQHRGAAISDFGAPISLDEAISGSCIETRHGPGCYLVEKPARELEQAAVVVHSRFVQLTGHPDGQAVERLARICKSDRIDPCSVLFIDLETTGLGGVNPLFLIGTMECSEQGFYFRQYFARDYSEEPSVLSAFCERLKAARLAITFNGKTFDLPFLRSRSIATGVPVAEPASHLDVLWEARRRYRGQLPNCRLQTLESIICGRCRDDDIPGSEIPEVYHDFVRTGNANRIGVVLLHNLYDLLTMADLLHRMWLSE